ncbi:MAG: DNA polymerase III subunit gamma/tau [Candidatus Zhuqueibacterota bacterium]
MAYLVLARKWRPQKFEDVVNQKHVVTTLQNALKTMRLANAYLFAGPRGIGKTTIARILAKAINCEQGPAQNPCNTCSSCTDITEGRSLDVLEIDGASNRGIDEVRNLRESLKYAPNPGKYKIYIIDEVHMLTTEAFNALLKTLEEPPSRVMFVFATTEPHKVPATIISRCQRFDFKRITLGEIIEQLKSVCSQENISIDDDSLQLIARKAEGSMRDSQSLLDQAISFCGDTIHANEIMDLLGVINWEIYFDFTNHIAAHDLKAGFQLVDKIFYNGYDLVEFLLGVNEHLRNILITKSVGSVELIEASDLFRQRYQKIAPQFQEQDLLRLIQMSSDAQYSIKRSANPRIFLEMVVMKMIQMDKTEKIEALIKGIDRLRADIQTGGRTIPATGYSQAQRPANQARASENTAPVSQSVQESSPQAAPVVKDNPVEKAKAVPEEGAAEEAETDSGSEASSQQANAQLEQIKQQWPQIIDEIKKRKIALGSFLGEGHPEKITEDNVLIIGFNADNAFHMNSVNKNKKNIEEIFQEVLGLSLRIKCIQTKILSEATASTPNGNTYMDRLTQKIPLIKTIVDEFDGELIK